jgi:hypothetical protein
MMPAFLTTRELAVALGVCEHTILRQAKRGQIPGARAVNPVKPRSPRP